LRKGKILDFAENHVIRACFWQKESFRLYNILISNRKPGDNPGFLCLGLFLAQKLGY
jgi:hypothetical protein